MLIPTVKAGQNEDDFLAWCGWHKDLHIRVASLTDPEATQKAREGAYSRALYKTKPSEPAASGAWYDALSQFQRDLLERVKQRRYDKRKPKTNAERREERDEKILAEKGRVVKRRRTNLTEEEKRKAAVEKDRRARARKDPDVRREEWRLQQAARRAKKKAQSAGETHTAATSTPSHPTPPELTMPAQRIPESPAEAPKAATAGQAPVQFGDDDILPGDVLADLDLGEDMPPLTQADLDDLIPLADAPEPEAQPGAVADDTSDAEHPAENAPEPAPAAARSSVEIAPREPVLDDLDLHYRALGDKYRAESPAAPHFEHQERRLSGLEEGILADLGKQQATEG